MSALYPYLNASNSDLYADYLAVDLISPSGGIVQQQGLINLRKALDEAFQIAEKMKDEYVSTEHLLIALTNAKGEEVARLLQSQGVTKDSILKVLVSIRGSQKIDLSPAKSLFVGDSLRDMIPHLSV